MKTFFEILNKVYSQSELIDRVKAAFDDYTDDEKNSVLIALSEIWEELTPVSAMGNSFKDRAMSFNTVASTSVYSLPYGKVKSIKESTSSRVMNEENNFDNMPVLSGLPYSYSLENNAINLYPTPDDVYTVNVKYYTDYKATDGAGTPVEKETLEAATDVLNIPAYLEDHFLITLGYKTGVNITSDPQAEEYVHWVNNYATALKTLKMKCNRSSTPPTLR
jgi:hypothetical protein